MPNLTLLAYHTNADTHSLTHLNKRETILYIFIFFKKMIQCLWSLGPATHLWPSGGVPLLLTGLCGLLEVAPSCTRPLFFKAIRRTLFCGLCNLWKPCKSTPCPQHNFGRFPEAAQELSCTASKASKIHMRRGSAFENSCHWVLVNADKLCHVTFDTYHRFATIELEEGLPPGDAILLVIRPHQWIQPCNISWFLFLPYIPSTLH